MVEYELCLRGVISRPFESRLMDMYARNLWHTALVTGRATLPSMSDSGEYCSSQRENRARIDLYCWRVDGTIRKAIISSPACCPSAQLAAIVGSIDVWCRCEAV
ncbi:hypothetical protein H310_01634 [Aphanomyces invadans]|uniref:Uncharacterized protein n=1 Tax=Aphanomyces invadans TaxID=157072 RepID=A0A024USB0_9STRA|nr:hypothetical protein H310_01634 [Aphanomyces invadans]ETW09229.1 hypothetical protein H310_01634 [Aphanomyces invadans]|eukprot:XP_008863034.1 hypothetical protein H310_01634 [Aphanomyces invadans]